MLKETDVTAAFRLFASLGLAGGPTSQAATVAMVEAWVDVLGDMDPADFAAAARQATRKSAFWPKPSDVLGCSTAVAQAKLAEVDRRIDWWPALIKAIGSAGKNATDQQQGDYFQDACHAAGLPAPSQDELDQIEAALASVGGWYAVAIAPSDDLRWMAPKFKKAMEERKEAASNVFTLDAARQRAKQLPHGNPKRIG